MPPTMIETDLKDILGNIQKELKEIREDIQKDLKEIRDDLTDLKVNQARMEERLSGQISLVEEKVTGLGKRLDFQEFVNRGILTALVVTLIAGAAKFFGFMPNS
ncbi:MAG: hypothetical protein ACKN9E_15795 [Microcystaceae cyanobacterium]